MAKKKNSKPLETASSTPVAGSVAAPPSEEEEYEMTRLSLVDATKIVEGETTVVKSTETPVSVTDLVAMLPEEITDMGAKGRGMILGVNTVMVLKSFCLHLAAARLESNPAPLVHCGVLAVAIAYTVSRDWVDEYAALPSPHMFSSFEIQGRKTIKATDDKIAIDWVARSDMNAAALRIFGSMVVEAGQGSSFLKYVKETAGTIYEPIEGGRERDTLMKEAAKSVGVSDRAALDSFRGNFKKYAEVVGALFGGGEVDFVPYVEAVVAMGEVTI